MLTTVTPAGAIFLLGGVFLGLAVLPLDARGNPRSACQTGQRRRYHIISLLEGAALAARSVPMWHSEVVALPVLATAQGVSLRGAMYAIANTLQSTHFQFRPHPATCSLHLLGACSGTLVWATWVGGHVVVVVGRWL
jgi:hypothetical protein